MGAFSAHEIYVEIPHCVCYTFPMDNMQGERSFIWDEHKDRINLKKHGISFETAMYVFADEARIEWYDEEHSDTEDRYKVLGRVGRVVLVVFTEQEEHTRIISARLANAQERRRCYNGRY